MAKFTKIPNAVYPQGAKRPRFPLYVVGDTDLSTGLAFSGVSGS